MWILEIKKLGPEHAKNIFRDISQKDMIPDGYGSLIEEERYGTSYGYSNI
jgi:hypothetical protein